MVANSLSLAFALFQENKWLSFTDALAYMSVFSILISGFVFLDQFGYFDVFGYSFKKTYLVLMKRYNDLDDTDRSRYKDIFSYKTYRDERRSKPNFSFYGFTLLLLIESILFVILYTQS